MQAKKGGEIGLNSEFYKGGQFLPSSEFTVKGVIEIVIHKGTKKEVAPYKWEASPDDNMLSIYERIRNYCYDNRKECNYEKGVGLVGFAFISPREKYINYMGESIPMPQEWSQFCTALIARFNSGERWFELELDPWHYKNQK